MQSAPLIRLEHVTRRFGDGRIVGLAGVDFALWKGETVALLGRSGSGKSTLINVMSGLLVPDSGRIEFDGRAIVRADEWARLRACKIGIIFQHYDLLPTLTAEENVEIPMFGVERSAAARQRRTRVVLDRLGLGDRANHLPAQLSGGERQRVAIARSLVNDPELVLADEPTGSLDTATGANVAELLLALARENGTTLFVATHDSELAGRLNRRLTIVDGRIVEPGPVPAGDPQREPAMSVT